MCPVSWRKHMFILSYMIPIGVAHTVWTVLIQVKNALWQRQKKTERIQIIIITIMITMTSCMQNREKPLNPITMITQYTLLPVKLNHSRKIHLCSAYTEVASDLPFIYFHCIYNCIHKAMRSLKWEIRKKFIKYF